MALATGAEIQGNRTFPCHSEVDPDDSSCHWLTCPRCGTRIRREPMSSEGYGDDYPAARGHHDPEIALCKARTLERWLAEVRIDVAGKIVCEIGFGGAGCLAAMHTAGATVLGLEPIAANREHARVLGIPLENLFDVDPLPVLPLKPDFWLLLDSFEHVPNPNQLARWMAEQSSPRAQVLLVAPDAGSISRKLMRQLWIHEVPDHFVHYSRAGILAIFSRAGFRFIRTFRPVKLVSLGMVWSHLRLLARAPAAANKHFGDNLRIWFNIGEMGLLLERDDSCR
jgi:hypothetical protein